MKHARQTVRSPIAQFSVLPAIASLVASPLIYGFIWVPEPLIFAAVFGVLAAYLIERHREHQDEYLTQR